MEEIIKVALDLSQKRITKKRHQREAERKSLKGLLTLRGTTPRSFKRSSKRAEKLGDVKLPYLEMPQSSLKAFGVLPFKKRRVREF